MTKPREITLLRREQVKELYFVKGYTIHYIANYLDWNYETIWNDIQNIKDKTWIESSKIDLIEHLAKLIFSNEERIRILWDYYDNGQTTKERICILNSIREEERHFLDILERFGVLKGNILLNKDLHRGCITIEDVQRAYEDSKKRENQTNT